MKYVIAIIKPHKLEDVRAALDAIGVSGLTASEAKGFGRQKGQTEIYRGAEYATNLLPKAKIEVAVPDALAGQVVDTIVHGEATPIHRGKTTQVWQTRVTSAEGKLLGIVTQTQIVIPK